MCVGTCKRTGYVYEIYVEINGVLNIVRNVSYLLEYWLLGCVYHGTRIENVWS